MSSTWVVGLMSGTSADGVDAALVNVFTIEDEELPGATVPSVFSSSHPEELQRRILAAAAGDAGTREIALLRREVTLRFAHAASSVTSGAHPSLPSLDELAALGCHGQTVWHEPPLRGAHGALASGPGTSLQLLDPALLAAETGIPVVSDFRSADLAAGGEGAPLVPWGDAVLFGEDDRNVAVLNLGGVANVTYLPAGRTLDGVIAFDTGPGNGMMDEAVALATAGRERMDRDGAWAAAGRVDEELLARLLADPFFEQAPPRSTGRERFGRERVAALAAERGLVQADPSGWADLIATLTAFAGDSVVEALRRWVDPRGVDTVLAAGGGVHNPVLMSRLRGALAPLPVLSHAQLPWAPQAREPAAFGLLAWAFLNGVPGNVPAATGASGPRVLGSWTPAPGREGRP